MVESCGGGSSLQYKFSTGGFFFRVAVEGKSGRR